MEIPSRKKEIFFLPTHMIDRIDDKVVYLNLDDKEFEKWWEKERDRLISEYHLKVGTYSEINEEDKERIAQMIKIAFEGNFGGVQTTSALEREVCPYCRGSIEVTYQQICPQCGLSYTTKKGEYVLTKEAEEALKSKQWALRMFLPFVFNDLLRPEEWTYHWSDLDPEILVVTSQRLIQYREGGGQDHNWEIPSDRITSTNLYYKDYTSYGLPGFKSGTAYLRIRYKTDSIEKKITISKRVRLFEFYEGELYFVNRYLRMLNEHIVSRRLSLWEKITDSQWGFGIRQERKRGWYARLHRKASTRFCSHCSNQIDEITLLCPNCGEKTFAAQESFGKTVIERYSPKLFTCPQCSLEIEKVGPFCPSCGVNIDEALEE